MSLASPGSPSAEAIAVAGQGGLVANRRNLVLLLAGLTTITEVGNLMGVIPDLPIGGLDLSMSLLPALGLALACGSRLLGRSTIRRAAAGFWLVVGVLLPILGILYYREGRFELFPALILAALDEELVYRLAVPAVVAAVLRLGNVRPNAARIAGLTAAGMWWCLLPGHREQIHQLVDVLPYVAFATLAAFIVYRSGSVLPLALGHAVSNLLTVLMWQEAVATDTRSLFMASVLALLVLAYGRTSRITIGDDGGLIDIHTGLTVSAIDLRDGQPALVELTDGRILPVHQGMVRPPEVPKAVLERRRDHRA